MCYMCEHPAHKSAIIMAKQWITELWLYVVARYPEFTSYCFIKIIGQLMVISKILLHAKPEEYKKKRYERKKVVSRTRPTVVFVKSSGWIYKANCEGLESYKMFEFYLTMIVSLLWKRHSNLGGISTSENRTFKIV